MNAKKQIRCAIYTRKSTEEGLEQEFNSLDAQRESCEAYVASQKAEGWVAVPQHYDDGGISGGTLERPALRQLIDAIEGGGIDVVVVYKIDRLSRSLMDFAKLVEIFDRKNVTFVSVTQSFNTTTSMGRLTLNVLLSFAQFEREVTGERIRDKFAASKKKGMWMGGNPPLGYDIKDRKLIVNVAEAETVNLIFRRYLDFRSVRELREDLIDKKVVSKIWTSTAGQAHGGKSFDRGALYCLLKNRVYVGESMHKGASYAGEHKAIVARDLFDAVQHQLEGARRRTPGKPSIPQDALLAGLIFDGEGTPMVPTYSTKPDGRRYRYYASQSRLQGKPTRASISRVPAAPMEEIITGRLARFRLIAPDCDGTRARQVLRRIQVNAASLVIELDRAVALQRWIEQEPEEPENGRDAMGELRSMLSAGEELSEDRDRLILTLPIRARFRGGRAAILQPRGTRPSAARPDAALIKAIARARRWVQLIEARKVISVESLAAGAGQERRHAGRILALAFLSPDLTKAMLDGHQPAGLRLAHLLETEIPVSWREQRALFDRTFTGLVA